MKQLAAFVFVLLTLSSFGQIRKDSLYRYQRAQAGVTIPKDAKWFNTKRPFSVFDLTERVLLIHTWDPFEPEGLVSIQKMNKVQEEYPSFVVLTVVPDSIMNDTADLQMLHLVSKYKINHPVVRASDLSSMKRVSRDCPSVQVVRSDGQNSGYYVGDSLYYNMDLILPKFQIGNEVMDFAQNEFVSTGLRSSLRSVMNYPSDITASQTEQRVFVADPGNHRIIAIDFDGQCNEVFGTGVKGSRDGKVGAAQFNYPMGLTLDEENRKLYVADAFNHSIREIDLKTKDVRTILGNGEQVERDQKWVDSTNTGLNFPTDVCLRSGKLMITMTGHQQIWEYDFKTKRARAASGNGRDISADGERGNTAYNNPTSLTADKKGNMYVLDAGSSQLRVLSPEWVLSTVDLGEIELNNPSGIDYADGKVFITDTRNHRIVSYDIGKKKAEVVSGLGTAGFKDDRKGESLFNSPQGLAMMGDELWVVDSYNQAIRKVDPKKGRTETVRLSNTFRLFRNIEAYSEGDKVYLEEELLSDGNSSFYIELELPDELEWYTDGRNDVFMSQSSFNRLIATSPDKGYLEFECRGSEMNPYAGLELYMTVRHKKTGMVLFRPVLLVVPFIYEPDARKEHDLKWQPFAKDPNRLTPFPWQ